MLPVPGRRIVFLHAHPDDETLATGALLAALAADGYDVAVVTATRGEQGEVVPGRFAALAGTQQLVAHRIGELAGALAELGVRSSAFLGTPPARAAGLPPRIYTDSGMRWVTDEVAGPSGDAGPDSLTAADVGAAAADLTAYLRSFRADALIAYDEHGGYGHPDHVACHRIARVAARISGVPLVELVSESLLPTSGAERIDLPGYLPAVRRALTHHASQLSVDNDEVVHVGGQRQPIVTTFWLTGPHGTAPTDEAPPEEPPRIAIVGAGPSGLFAAAALIADPNVRVDIFDRLPTPFGLLRYGVAPDHASIKAVAGSLAAVFDSERVRFLGLVEFGRDITADELRSAYDAVIYAAGAAEDRRMVVPGEDLPGSRSAREFVAWYSGHPDAAPQSLAGVRTAVTVGVGNVAIDVARILLKSPAELAATDMPDAVLAELSSANIDQVWVIGRRGPEHASFTTTELREVLATPGIGVSVAGCDLGAIDDGALDRRTRANVAALALAVADPPTAPQRWLRFLFWHRPVEVLGEARVEGLRLESTLPAGPGRVRPGGEFTTIPADLVLRAIGYRGVPLPGVSFDDATGTIPTLAGRVLGADGSVRPGEYAVGWIKRGPIGVIGTNKKDAQETVASVLADLPERQRRVLASPDELLAAKGIVASTLADWRRIDAAEIGRGGLRGRERTKIEAWHELLDLVRSGRPGGPPSAADDSSATDDLSAADDPSAR